MTQTKTPPAKALPEHLKQAPISAITTWTQIEILSISDIHLGNAANPAQFVINGLDKKLTIKTMHGLNLLFIVGDVFDRIMPTNHRDIPYIISWIRRLLARCATLGIVVVVVEGTPSHDRLQSHLFVAINDGAEDEHKAELYYVKEVDILYIPKYDLNLLIVPDEKNTSDEVTYEQVKAMMKARAIDKVDFALMHGFFEFQVPFGVKARYHDSKSYLDLVRYLIFIGHDHEFQQRDRIFVHGSPDRQRHGMESDKGFIRATVYRDGNYRAKFEVNEHAMVFKTLELSNDIDFASNQVYNVCDSLPKHSHLRLAGYKSNPVFSSLDSLQSQYPFLRFSKKILDEDVIEDTNITESGISEDYVPFTIDSSNIKTIVAERLSIELVSDKEKAYFDELMATVAA